MSDRSARVWWRIFAAVCWPHRVVEWLEDNPILAFLAGWGLVGLALAWAIGRQQ